MREKEKAYIEINKKLESLNDIIKSKKILEKIFIINKKRRFFKEKDINVI